MLRTPSWTNQYFRCSCYNSSVPSLHVRLWTVHNSRRHIHLATNILITKGWQSNLPYRWKYTTFRPSAQSQRSFSSDISAKKSPLSTFIASIRSRSDGVSSFKKIVALAKPERKFLLIAVGLLLVSSTVSMSIPFTVGRLIDYFTSPIHVCASSVLIIYGTNTADRIFLTICLSPKHQQFYCSSLLSVASPTLSGLCLFAFLASELLQLCVNVRMQVRSVKK